MLRIVIRYDDASMAANVGGSVHSSFKTFDVDLPEVEKALRYNNQYGHAQVLGVELLDNT